MENVVLANPWFPLQAYIFRPKGRGITPKLLLMRSIACRTPVIASKFSSFSFVKDYQLGFLVNHSCEISSAIQEIIDNKKAYSKRCLDFVQTEVSFDKY